MSEPLACYRCGASLAVLSLPLGRRDECPSCRAELHVCRMCVHYAPRLSRGCDEDDAPDVRNRESANFCDYFKPSPKAYDAAGAAREAAARDELARLFGEASGAGASATHEIARNDRDATQTSQEADKARAEAEALFKR